MALLTLNVYVSNIAVVRSYFDRIKVYRSTTGLAGPYIEITDGSTRVALLLTQSAYSYTDATGDETYFYRTSFFNSVTLVESALSDAQQGSGDAALDVLPVSVLVQNYLFGIPLEDQEGNAFPDAFYQHYIRAAVAYVERRLDMPLRTLSFTDEAPEAADFIRQDYWKNIWLQLKNYPVLSVDRITLVLPVGQQIIDYDPTWMAIDKDAGVVQIIPGAGTLVLGASSSWLPFLYGWTDFIPDVFRISYSAGFLKGQVPPELVHLVGMVAAIHPLAVAGDLIFGPGVAGESVGLDALMTNMKAARSATASVFSARIAQYQRQIDEMFKELRRYYKGIRMVMG